MVKISAKPLDSTATLTDLIISLPTFQEEVKWPDAAAKLSLLSSKPHLTRFNGLTLWRWVSTG
jgi:hypothetical protein